MPSPVQVPEHLMTAAAVPSLERQQVLAMRTARRLGAVVTGYDIRPETREQIESVGARFLRLASVAPAEGEGGYARALTAEEQAAQQAELAAQIARFDVVITTAQVPGRRARPGAHCGLGRVLTQHRRAAGRTGPRRRADDRPR
jgi:hypothetical protein